LKRAERETVVTAVVTGPAVVVLAVVAAEAAAANAIVTNYINKLLLPSVK